MKEIILSCLLALFMATPLCSQNAGHEKNTAKVKKQGDGAAANEKSIGGDGQDLMALKAEIEALNAKIDTLHEQCNALDVNLKKTDSLLKVEKNRWKTAGMNGRIKELNKKKTALSTSLVNKTDSLKKEYGNRLYVLSRKDSINVDSISLLDERLASLEDFKNMWMADFADSIVDSFIGQSYSAVKLSELEDLYRQYNELAEVTPQASSAKERLGHFVDEYRLFQKGTEAVNVPYDHELVNSLIVPMQSMRDASQDDVKRQELTNLARRLFNYDVTVEIFEEIIAEVDDAVKNCGTKDHAVAYRAVEKILKRQVDDGVVGEIEDIPWLKEVYGEYCRLLKENCLKRVNLQLKKK